MKIRKAFIKDAKKIAEIKYYTWLDAYKDILGKDLIQSNMDLKNQTKKIQNQIRSNDKNISYYVCSVDDNIIAYCLLLHKSDTSRDGEGSFIGCELKDMNVGECMLSALYVLPEYQRNGVGQFFFDWIKFWCKERNVSKLFWNCYVENKKAVNFYLKNSACIINENIGETFGKSAKGYEMELYI